MLIPTPCFLKDSEAFEELGSFHRYWDPPQRGCWMRPVGGRNLAPPWMVETYKNHGINQLNHCCPRKYRWKPTSVWKDMQTCGLGWVHPGFKEFPTTGGRSMVKRQSPPRESLMVQFFLKVISQNEQTSSSKANGLASFSDPPHPGSSSPWVGRSLQAESGN